MLTPIKTLLSSIVDYAGLFPPAKLDLPQAMTQYSEQRTAAYEWMLGTFVLPSSRLDDLEKLLPQFTLPQWSLSLILSQNWQADLEKALTLQNPKITITALEFPPLSPTEIEKALHQLPTKINAFFEIPFSEEITPFLAILKNPSASAKLRTGGLTSNAFPSAAKLGEFIYALGKEKVSFKATAGLHHPLRSEQPLTPEPLLVKMHGFLNLALFAALVYGQKASLEAGINLLEETHLDHFQFLTDRIFWRDYELSLPEIEQSRLSFFQSFGSCSLSEPIEDLKQLQLIS
ncbi:hypothetical protein [Gloeothece verrucosa]|uniref:Uncharacterized protein n=1 Tax=Gloeothece verrucosa (strain PCC 7822) TaxID=497965 RepID=E0U9B7_GLOV7|nr:hypothetical protein [Gloeothece verrucosa]ADN12609.1 conserved hypothetical protein [Gloeothece verrucosa PCC 7822]